MYVYGVESYVSLMQVVSYVSSYVNLMQVCDDWIIYTCMNLMQIWVVEISVKHVYASLCDINLHV